MAAGVNWGRVVRTAGSVLDLIGNTPLVQVRPPDGSSVRILAKCEFVNPTGSHKDRIYHRMILEAENRGDLRPGMTIVEASTGNAGTSCAMVGSLKGYKVVVVMPEGMSEERKKLIRAFGGEIIFTPGGESDQDLALARVQEMIESRPGEYWFPGQFDNPDNPLAHYHTTGAELLEQTEGKVDAFVAAVGSGGTLSGVGRRLKETLGDIKVYAVEPEECAIMSKRKWGSHHIQGIGDGFVPKNLDLDLVDGVIVVSSFEAITTAQRLMHEQGLAVGISSGCNVAAVTKLSKKHPEFRTITTILFDSAQRYFTSPLFGVEREVAVPQREHQLDPETIALLDRHASRWEII